MHPAVTYDPEELAAVCRKHNVKVLEAFGSAVRDDFQPDRSDVDLLVLYGHRGAPPEGVPRGLDALAIREELAAVFGRPVDVVNVRAVSNPYFFESAFSHRERLYAA